MKTVRTILVPTDFSNPARHALDEAIGLARVFGSELHLLHCFQAIVPSTLTFYSLEIPASFERDLRRAGEQRMVQWSQRVKSSGVTVHDRLAVSVASTEIVEYAGRIGADLVVMGTRGLGGLKHVLLGSVAERTVRLAPCPVMTVNPAGREGGQAAPPAVGAGTGEVPRKEIREILVPVDFSSHSERALEEAIAYASTFGARVHLLHCYQIHPQAIAPYGIVVPETFDRELRMAAQQRLSEWRDKVTAAGCKAQEHLSADFPSEAIAEAAEQLGADLVVIGTRGLTGFKHALLGSVAERTIRTVRCPVLSVKSGETS